MRNLPNLNPLRFVLSVFVLIYHLPLISKTLNIPNYNDAPIFRNGILAVYYFFTLSGFLILRLIYSELKKTKKFDFKNFYQRRIRRLYPVYYLVLFTGLTLYHFILPKIGILYNRNYSINELVLNYVFFIPNVFRYNHPNTGSILIIMWSIGIEEQFYLFMPVFMYFFRNKIVISVLILLIILLLTLLLLPSFYVYTNFYFYFLFGGLLSILSLDKKIALLNNKLLHIIIYALFILSFSTNFFAFQNIFIFHLFNLIISGLLILLLSTYPSFIIENRIINHFGKISYGIYMYNMIVITSVLYVTSKIKPYNYINHTIFIIILNFIVILLTIAVSHYSYKYFESKFYKSRY
jgi:peptidoglycan/LPS O-acetylase OafA/YrhL